MQNAVLTEQVEPAICDQKWRHRKRSNRQAQADATPMPFRSRQPQRGHKAKRERQQRCCGADEQAVLEQEPVHFKNTSFNCLVVASKSRSIAGQSGCRSVMPGLFALSNAFASTRRLTTSGFCNQSKSFCAASAWGALRMTPTVFGISKR